MNKHAGGIAGKTGSIPDGLTETDLILGKKAVRISLFLCLLATLALVAMAVYVYQSVPLDTRMPYSGRGGRSGRGIPMPIAVMICLIFPFILWRSVRKPSAHHMAKGARVALYVVTAVMFLGTVFGQWSITKAILVEGGVLSG